jgi:hypothetical protein
MKYGQSWVRPAILAISDLVVQVVASVLHDFSLRSSGIENVNS